VWLLQLLPDGIIDYRRQANVRQPWTEAVTGWELHFVSYETNAVH
jgi:hypothetical protein